MEGEGDEVRRVEELEALEAIYGEMFTLESESSCGLRVGEAPRLMELHLHLPPSYPSLAPPTFTYSAPFLSSQEKERLRALLEEVYLENMGEAVLFLWVERCREFLLEGEGEEQVEEEEEEVVIPVAVTSEEVWCPDILTGPTLEDRKSVFQGHVATVVDSKQVTAVMEKLKENSKIARATHNMLAYRIEREGLQLLQDCDDDGEDAAGGRMLHLLQVLDVKNVLVVVSRWYGGTHLGPDRFKHINNVTRQVLELGGLVAARPARKKAR